MSFDLLNVAMGCLGLSVVLLMFMKSKSTGNYQPNPDIQIHPPKIKIPEDEEDQKEETEEESLAPPPAELDARMRFYQQEAKEEALNQKEKSLEELQAEVMRKSRESKLEQDQKDLKNRNYYLQQQEKLNSAKGKGKR